MSAYQTLVEGKMDIIFNKEGDEKTHVNISELLRDLYKKIYALEAQVSSLNSRVPKLEKIEPVDEEGEIKVD